MELIEVIQASNKILNADTTYLKNKDIIKGYFNSEQYTLDCIISS